MENIKKTRILQVCRLTPLWGMDLSREITKSLKSENTEIITVFLSGKAQPDLKNKYHGDIIFLELNRRSLFWRIKAFFKLLHLCRMNKFDIILCHHYKPTAIMQMVSFFIKPTKLYSMYHDSADFRKKSQQIFLAWIKKRWHFIAVSNPLKKEIRSFHIPEDNISVVHNTVDIEKLRQNQLGREAARHQLNLPQDAFIFGTLGRLSPEKGHEILINAFLNADFIQNPKIHLVIIGSGPLENELKTQIDQSDQKNHIHIITSCASDGAKYLRALDIFVLPSHRETFGIVLLEAACAELPIIASRVGGIPEAVGNHGFLVPPNDPDALKTALEKYFHLSQAEREHLGKQGLKYTQENFSLKKYHQNIRFHIKP